MSSPDIQLPESPEARNTHISRCCQATLQVSSERRNSNSRARKRVITMCARGMGEIDLSTCVAAAMDYLCEIIL